MDIVSNILPGSNTPFSGLGILFSIGIVGVVTEPLNNILHANNATPGANKFIATPDIVWSALKVTVANAKNQLEMIGTNKKEDMSDSERKIYDQCIGILVHEEEMMYDFDRIEDERKGFQCFCVGGFDKGAIAKEDEKLVKTVGYEYVWCKGLPAEYTDIPKVTDKD